MYSFIPLQLEWNGVAVRWTGFFFWLARARVNGKPVVLLGFHSVVYLPCETSSVAVARRVGRHRHGRNFLRGSRCRGGGTAAGRAGQAKVMAATAATGVCPAQYSGVAAEMLPVVCCLLPFFTFVSDRGRRIAAAKAAAKDQGNQGNQGNANGVFGRRFENWHMACMMECGEGAGSLAAGLAVQGQGRERRERRERWGIRD